MLGLCTSAPLLGIGAEVKAPVLLASPSAFLNQPHYGWVAFSPDGKYMTYSPRGMGAKLHILEVATNKVLYRISAGLVTFTPDSTRFIYIHPIGKWEPMEEKPPYKDDVVDRIKVPAHRVDVYDVKTGKRLHQIPLLQRQPFGVFPHGNILTVAVSDTCIAVADKGAVATIYDLKTGKVAFNVPGRLRSPTRLVLSHDGRWLLTLDSGRHLCTWDLKTRKQDRVLFDHKRRNASEIAISADGRYCCSASHYGDVVLFDRTTGEMKNSNALESAHCRIGLTADGKRVVAHVEPTLFRRRVAKTRERPTEWDTGVRLWDWETEKPPTIVMIPWSAKAEAEMIGKGNFTPHIMTGDGKRFLSADGRTGIMLLDLTAPLPKPEVQPDPKPDRKPEPGKP